MQTFMRPLLVSCLVLLSQTSAFAYPFVCQNQYVRTPVTKDPTVSLIVNTIQEVAGGQLMTAMANGHGHTYEFCWMDKEGQPHPAFKKGVGTAFWSATANDGTKASGIVYTIEMLNEVIKHSKKAEHALLPALFVIYHEIGHATIHFGLDSGELAKTVKNKEVMFWISPLADKYKGRETELFQTLNGNRSGSETFADCYGAYLMGIAMLFQNEANGPIKFYDRVSRMQYNQQSFNDAMALAATIASELIGQDEHGTAVERQSFVRYGVDVAAHYLPLMRLNALRAANSAMLACANMAYEQDQAKAAFKKKTGLNSHFTAPLFDKKQGY